VKRSGTHHPAQGGFRYPTFSVSGMSFISNAGWWVPLRYTHPTFLLLFFPNKLLNAGRGLQPRPKCFLLNLNAELNAGLTQLPDLNAGRGLQPRPKCFLLNLNAGLNAGRGLQSRPKCFLLNLNAGLTQQ